MKKLLCVLSLLCSWAAGWSCTNFLVGKDATIDGCTMLSYSADSYSLYGYLHFAPAADYPKGAMREVIDWDKGKPLGQIPQVSHTYSVVGNMNEHQLTIGETTWGGRLELMDTTGGIDYGSLIYIALERCKTAREAIECMTSLVKQYGYCSEGETFSIADPEEIWMMDMVGKGPGRKGAVWVAVRVPDSCIAAHANQSRIQTLPMPTKKAKAAARKTGVVDMGDWKYSADVITIAREKGYFTGQDEDFSFQAAYNPYDFVGLYVCEGRVWSFFRQFDPTIDRYMDYALGNTFRATGGKDAGEPMPLWIRPNRKVTLKDMRQSMRDHYDGTDNEITKGVSSGPWHSKLRYGSLGFELDSVKYWYPRPTATQQTAWSYIAQMRQGHKAGGILWFGVDDAATSLYVPMYSSMNRIPECYRKGNGDLYTYSPTSAWWVYNITANWAYTKYDAMRKDIVGVQQLWEERFDYQIPMIDAQAERLPEAQRSQYLTEYSVSQAEQSTAAWKELCIYLFVKYLDGQQRREKDGQFERNAWGCPVSPYRTPCPEPWLRLTHQEVEHE